MLQALPLVSFTNLKQAIHEGISASQVVQGLMDVRERLGQCLGDQLPEVWLQRDSAVVHGLGERCGEEGNSHVLELMRVCESLDNDTFDHAELFYVLGNCLV